MQKKPKNTSRIKIASQELELALKEFEQQACSQDSQFYRRQKILKEIKALIQKLS